MSKDFENKTTLNDVMSDNKVETELLSQIKEVLLKFPKYWEKDVLLRNKVAEDLRNYNQALIEALLSNQLVKDTYSISLNSTNIFKIEEFINMLRYKNYWENSYTKYSNEIGLTSEGKYLNYNTDVVLDFPHKDNILEGGMTKEDQGKKEIYYHNVLAKEEIDLLFYPKILTNIKKYNSSGEHKIAKINDNDNLIIKGNNLIALHTLKERYFKKIKLIIIDPPYYFKKQKSSDAFRYNSNFKMSTWLTFMKNRLEIAKELLSDDGFISIIIGEDGNAYLKVLCDSIFGSENYVTTISWRKTDNQSNIGEFANVKDNILIYKKTNTAKLGKLPLSDKAIKEYQYEDELGKYGRGILKDEVRGRYNYEIVSPSGRKVSGPWMVDEKDFQELKKNNQIHWPLNGEVPRSKIYLKEAMEKGQITSDFWDSSYGTNQRGATEMKNLFGSRIFDFPKPEKLIMNLISLGSKKNDIVLDFFMGSATTQAVALKMDRQFIGVEQMDYINTVSVPRLKKVIEGEQGGISKDVDWQGGGSFVYAELASLNERYVKDIQQASNEAELEKVLSTMKESAYLNFKVDLERVSSKDKGYNALSLEEKKEVLIQVLDMNQLYLSYSEIEDEQYKIPEDVKAFNHSFYQKEGVQDE